MPAAVVGMISDYGHTFSDSDVEKMFYEYYCEVGITQRGPFLEMMMRDGRRDPNRQRTDNILNVMIAPYYHNLPHWVTFIICGLPGGYRDEIFADEYIWDHLLDTFGPDGSNELHRSRTLKILVNDGRVIDHWDEFCDAVIDLIYDHLYLHTYSLTCPRLPDPRPPKCALWPFNHRVNGVQIYRERPNLTVCGCNNHLDGY